MSKRPKQPQGKTISYSDPFRLLKAILIGVSLGFIAVMVVPYVAPKHHPPISASNAPSLPAQKEPSKPAAVHRDAVAPVTPAQPPKTAPPIIAEKLPSDSPPDENLREKQASSEAPIANENVALEERKPLPNTEERGDGEMTAAQPDKAPAQAEGAPAPAESKEAPAPEAEPVLVPAVQLTFPKPFSDNEMAQALKPLLSFQIGAADVSSVKEVISAASKGQEEAARAGLSKISDPAARKFAQWNILRLADAPLSDIRAFRAANPLFPIQAPDGRIEKSLFLSDASTAEVLKFFANRKPQTGAGKASLGAALIDSGEREKGRSLIRQAWTRHELDPAVQTRMSTRFAGLLGDEDINLRKLWLALKLRRKDSGDVKSSSKSGGLKEVALLRGRHSKGKSLHGGSHDSISKKKRERAERHRGRGGRDGGGSRRSRNRHTSFEEHLQDLETAGSTKEAAFAVPSILEHVSSRRRKHRANRDNEDKTGAAGVKEKKSKNGKSADKKKESDSAPEAKKPAEVQQDKPGAESKKPETETSAKKDGTNGKSKAKAVEKPAAQTAQQKEAGKAIKLTREIAASPTAILNRLKSLHRQHSDRRMWAIFRSLNANSADLSDPDKWWDFRRTEVRRALNLKHPRAAYAIAKTRGPIDDEGQSESEFLTGWIALRFLKQPDLAERHFKNSLKTKSSARDEARALYWQGRTKIEKHENAAAEDLFKEASARFYTYYGQLARQYLDKNPSCEFRAPPKPSASDIASFVAEDAFKSAVIAKQLDLQPVLVSLFLDLARQVTDPSQMTLVLELAERIAAPHVAIRAAKIALFRGFAVEAYAFPALLPKFDKAGTGENQKLEQSLLNALTRQESEFHSGSVSSVGARGLMQLMPGTARLVSGTIKVKYDQNRLISDPSYNVTLGSAYLASLMSGYDGSYILSLAGYNAGPGRANQWIKEFGDPRAKSVDPVDWVERIPFTETRDYVQRILESTQLYRCRFENGKARVQLLQDLHRGKPGKIPDLAGLTGIEAPEPSR